jgi:hypothetical protein
MTSACHLDNDLRLRRCKGDSRLQDVRRVASNIVAYRRDKLPLVSYASYHELLDLPGIWEPVHNIAMATIAMDLLKFIYVS